MLNVSSETVWYDKSHAREKLEVLAWVNSYPTHTLGKAPPENQDWVKFGKQAAITKMKNGRKNFAGRMKSECKSYYWRLILMHFPLNPCFSDVTRASLICSPVCAWLHLDALQWDHRNYSSKPGSTQLHLTPPSSLNTLLKKVSNLLHFIR